MPAFRLTGIRAAPDIDRRVDSLKVSRHPGAVQGVARRINERHRDRKLHITAAGIGHAGNHGERRTVRRFRRKTVRFIHHAIAVNRVIHTAHIREIFLAENQPGDAFLKDHLRRVFP